MCQLEGKGALITGAASGIGRATALRFAEAGAAVFGFDRSEPDANEWKDGFFEIGDVRDEDRVAAVVAAAVERLGSLDVVVNAAGVAGGGPVHLVDESAWDDVLDINLKGTFLVNKHALTPMLERGSGAIINIASIEGLEGVEGGSAYNASKGGVILLTKNMAMDYGRRGIRVNCICPGFIDTPLLQSVMVGEPMQGPLARIKEGQMGRLGRAEEIASGALFLASDEASFIAGHSLVIDGGYTAGHRLGVGEMLGLG
jgi:NAD(P)-dependent dehydrogenase (short-subunit alcohol dehydrogenase family)